MRNAFLLAIATAVAVTGCASAVSSKTTSVAATPPAVESGDRENGRLVFENNCSTCHGATGVEGGVGPSLRNERSRMDFNATAAWIMEPAPPMPHLYPKVLTQEEVRDVAAYVDSL